MQEGGNLASVDMSYDQAFLAGVVLNGMDTWIGLRRRVGYWILNELKTNGTKHLSSRVKLEPPSPYYYYYYY